MSKTTTAQLPDEAYEELHNEMALVRTETIFLRNAIDLLKKRTHEADYVKNGSSFLAGYTMAIQDLSLRTFNQSFDSYVQEDEHEPDWTPWEEKPF